MKDLKYEHQSIFPLWGRVKLILGTGTENQIFILRTPATIKFFHQILKNCHFGVKKNNYPPRWICMTHIWSPTLFPRGIIIFQGVLTKFCFSISMSTRALFPCGGGSNLILGTGTENQMFIPRTPATVKFYHMTLWHNSTLTHL